MASNVEKKHILEHIFDVTLRCPGLGQKLYDNGLRTPRQIYLNKGEGPWEDLKRDGVINNREHLVISVFLDWCDWFMKQTDHPGDLTKLPKTLVEWQYCLQLEAADMEPPSTGDGVPRDHTLGSGFSSQAAANAASTEPSNPNNGNSETHGVEETKEETFQEPGARV